MKTLNIHEAKTQLSKLLEEVQQGENIIIAKAGKPIATLSAYSAEISERTGGLLSEGAWEAEDAWEQDHELNQQLTSTPLYTELANIPSNKVAEDTPNTI